MPIYEKWCGACRQRVEYFSHRITETDPPCEACGGETKRCVSRFGVVWTKNIEDYGDPSKEHFHDGKKNGGHWAFRKNSWGADETGVPIPEFITSHAQQRAYCRDEGLIPPDDVGGSSFSVASDGETANNPAGEPGTWV